MTKLLEQVDWPATKGARKQAMQSHASMAVMGPAKVGPKLVASFGVATGRIEIVGHGSEKRKGSSTIKSGGQ